VSIIPPLSEVYGDGAVVTVVYDPTGTENAHEQLIAACVEALTRLDGRGLAPDTVRGVCHLGDADVPLVWLLRREWALAYDGSQAAYEDLFARIDETSPAVSWTEAGDA
jgi:hypothetical protein